MKSRIIFGIAGLVLTIAVMIPVLFFLSRGAVSTNQHLVIVSAPVALVLWTIPYATVVDPWLRRASACGSAPPLNGAARVGRCHGHPQRRRDTSQVSDLLGYCFIILWFVPFAAIGLVLWLRH